MSGSCFILTCYETVHRTVSAKFINEFGASCLLCFAQFTPPSKRRKAPKIAWTRCPSYFSIPPSATSCTHLPLQGRQKGLFNFDEARFSHFIDSLKSATTRRRQIIRPFMSITPCLASFFYFFLFIKAFKENINIK